MLANASVSCLSFCSEFEASQSIRSGSKSRQTKKIVEVNMPKQIKNNRRKWKNSECDEVVLQVHMHCDGCTAKVTRYLRGFEGVHEVKSDGKSYIVIVKRKAVDPLAVKERIERKSHGPVEITHMNIKAHD